MHPNRETPYTHYKSSPMMLDKADNVGQALNDQESALSINCRVNLLGWPGRIVRRISGEEGARAEGSYNAEIICETKDVCSLMTALGIRVATAVDTKTVTVVMAAS